MGENFRNRKKYIKFDRRENFWIREKVLKIIWYGRKFLNSKKKYKKFYMGGEMFKFEKN